MCNCKKNTTKKIKASDKKWVRHGGKNNTIKK